MWVPTAPRTVAPVVTQFARFWAANMDRVHQTGGNWPGFRYTDDEKKAMHEIAQRMSAWDFFLITGLVVLFMLLIAGGCVALMFAYLQVRYGSDPSKTPTIEFFFCLVLAIGATIGGGMPLSILAAAGLTAKLFPPDSATLPDPSFSRHLFVKAVGQIIRMAVVMFCLLMIYWLFVPRDSKVDVLLRLVMPTLGPSVSVLTALYYYAGRQRRSGDMAQ